MPIASFPELTAAEADAVTGDIQKIFFAFMEKFFNEYYGRVAEDKPQNMKITRLQIPTSTPGVFNTTYTVVLKTAILTQEVQPEA
jgi:hypothetical protein